MAGGHTLVHAFVMTNHEHSSSGRAPSGEYVTEHLIARECAGCGGPVRYAGTGRRPRYCSPSCRQRAWALRHAEHVLSAGADPRPQVIRETVERRVEPAARPAPQPAAATPTSGREWERLLHELIGQLADEGHKTHREHWHHRRLYNALVLAVRNLGTAHPGGLDQLAGR